MKLCFIGKYPPIQGGVSTVTYWLARGLAQRGHEVHVISNADEVEPAYRIALGTADLGRHEPSFSDSGGRVCLHTPARYSRDMFHIPDANPFVTKLAAVATDVIRAHGCELIFAFYFEPYAIAGYLASQWTGKPLVLKHAGSDIDRLMRIPDLATSYKEILRAADAVVTSQRLMPQMLDIGLTRDQLEADIPFSIPTEVFTPHAEPLDLASMALDGFAKPNDFDASLPTFGIYGKIGVAKGTFDLISALGILARDQLRFNLVCMIGGSQAATIANAVRKEGLETRTLFLPFLPNWRVPNFLRACTAVCFLERDFPIMMHGPIVAREILACGTCLIVSQEIVSKQRYREELRHDENVLVVADPKHHAELAAVLRRVVMNPGRARENGERGSLVARAHERHDVYIAGWEQLLERHLDLPAQGPPRRVLRQSSARVQSLVNMLRSIVCARLPALVARFAEPSASPIALCEGVLTALGSGDDDERIRVRDLVRYIKAHLMVSGEPGNLDTNGFPVADRLSGERASQSTLWRLRPVRGNSVHIVEFEHDVTKLGQYSDHERALAEFVREPTVLLFGRAANMVAYELRIDAAARALVEACDGSRTTAELDTLMYEQFMVDHPDRHIECTHQLLKALEWLYKEGMIVFGERREDGGWIGGLRGGADLITRT